MLLLHFLHLKIITVIYQFSFCQGRPGINGYKGEKGEPGGGSGFGYPVSVRECHVLTNSLSLKHVFRVFVLSEVAFCPDKLKGELPLYVLKRLNLTFAKYTQI